MLHACPHLIELTEKCRMTGIVFARSSDMPCLMVDGFRNSIEHAMIGIFPTEIVYVAITCGQVKSVKKTSITKIDFCNCMTWKCVAIRLRGLSRVGCQLNHTHFAV